MVGFIALVTILVLVVLVFSKENYRGRSTKNNTGNPNKYRLAIILLSSCHAVAVYSTLLCLSQKMALLHSWAYWFPGAFLFGMVSYLILKTDWMRSIVFTLIGTTLGVVLMIILDDSGDHNLAGIEVMVIDFFVFVSLLLGMIAGLILSSVVKRKSQKQKGN